MWQFSLNAISHVWFRSTSIIGKLLTLVVRVFFIRTFFLSKNIEAKKNSQKIIDIIFRSYATFYKNFDLPQIKWYLISSTKKHFSRVASQVTKWNKIFVLAIKKYAKADIKDFCLCPICLISLLSSKYFVPNNIEAVI